MNVISTRRVCSGYSKPFTMAAVAAVSLTLTACSPADQPAETTQQSSSSDTPLTNQSASASTALDSSSNSDANDLTTGSTNDSANSAIRIAAAANLSDVLPQIIEQYKADKHQPNQNIEVTYGSSGKLYAQAIAGAPYDVFLSANQEFAAKMAHEIHSQSSAHQPFTYARGQLALYSTTQPVKPLNEMTLTQVLKSQPNAKVTIANPDLAPYGASAKAYLQKEGLFDTLTQQKRLIQSENIGQAFQYTHTGNVDYGFVALSQVTAIKATPTQFYTLPAESYPAILQDALVISSAPAAEDFAQYLRSPAAQQLFAQAGYMAVD